MALLIKKLFNLENLTYLTVFSLPLYLIKIKFSFISANLLEIMAGSVFLVWLFRRKNLLGAKLFYLNYGKYIICSGLIFLGFTLSTFLNGNYLRGLGIIKSWFLTPVIFLLVAGDAINREKIINVFKAYYFSAFFVALLAFLYLILGRVAYDGRLMAFFNSPNYLAMYLSPGIIIGIVLMREEKSERLKTYLKSAMLAVILAAFYFTYSYAAWMSVLAAVTAIFLIENKFSFKKILIMTVILALLFFSQLKSYKLNDLLISNQKTSLASRLVIWRSALKMLGDNRISGIGPGNFQEKYLEYQKYYPPYPEWAAPHPHSLYLAFWLYGGMLSFLGFIGLVFYWFRDIFKFKNAVSFMAFGIMLYILIHGLADTTYFKNDLAVVFWFCFLALKKG